MYLLLELFSGYAVAVSNWNCGSEFHLIFVLLFEVKFAGAV